MKKKGELLVGKWRRVEKRARVKGGEKGRVIGGKRGGIGWDDGEGWEKSGRVKGGKKGND